MGNIREYCKMFYKLITRFVYLCLALAILCLVSANIGAIGYGLYLWAHDFTFPQAAWTAFVLWIQILGAALGFWLIGLGVAYATDKHV